MSLNADIANLNNALQVFTYGESIVSENVANVDTTGYTTQVLNLASLTDFSGVSVAGVGSARNTYLYNQIYSELAQQGYSTAQLQALNQISSILPEVANASSTAGLNGAINSLASAWSVLAAAPTSTADQTQVLNDMQSLADLFNTDSNQLYELQQNLNGQVQQAVTQVNSLEDQILTLNQQIVSLGGQQSAQTSTLIDQRQQAAQSLVGLTGGSVNYNTNGSMVVTFNGGTLVDGVQSYHLATMPSQTTPGLLDLGYVSVPGSSTLTDVTADFTGGTLGGLYSGEADVKQAVLALNQMASGIIQFTNEVNESAPAPGTTVTNALFNGTEASDISVNPEVSADPNLIIAGNDSANPGNLAAVQAAMTTLNMYSEVETISANKATQGGFVLNQTAAGQIDPTQAISGQLAKFITEPDAAGGTLVINSGGNAINVAWNTGDSLNQIVAMINAQGGGAVYATLQTVTSTTSMGTPPGQYIHIYSDAPMSIYDASGNLGQALNLNAVLYSSAPINNVPTTGVNQVQEFESTPPYAALALNSTSNTLALFTQPVAPVVAGVAKGTVEVNGNSADVATWEPTQTISAITSAIQSSATAGTLQVSFNQNQAQSSAGIPMQEVQIINTNSSPTSMTAANPLQSVSINDLTGNLTQVLNLNSDTNATQLFSQMTTTVGNAIAASTSAQTQAGNMVKATQTLQTAQSGVDEDAQLAQAASYENAYDAAVRLQYVLENMLNYLITQTGSPNSNSSPIGS